MRAELDALDGIRVMGDDVVNEQRAFEYDPLVFTVDVRGLGITGYQAAEFIRAAYQVDLGAADTCRVTARMTHSDDDQTAALLVDIFRRLVDDRDRIDAAQPVTLPTPGTLELDTVMLPRDAFFGPTEMVPVEKAAGRIAAEMISPYPPGVPVLAPGERISAETLDYLVSGVAAGMFIPDAADPQMATVKVVAT